MTRRNGLWALVFGAFLAAPLTAKAETLADAMAAAYENSGLLEQNRALLRAADEDVAQAVASLRPVLNWQFGVTAQRPTSLFQDEISAQLSVLGELVLWDAGRGELAVEAQKEIVLATRERLLGVEQEVLLRVVQAYMNIRRTSEFVALRESNVRLITQELRAAQDRFDVGEVTRTDVALAEARLAAARSFLAAEQGELARAQAEYVAAVGRAPGGGLVPASAAAIDRTLADAQGLAQQRHPAIREAQHTVTAAELNIAAAEAGMDPTFAMSTRLTVDEQGDLSSNLGLTLSGPIYQGGRLSSLVRQFQARRDAARSGLLLAADNVQQNVARAWSFLEAARASREASERQVRAATVAFNGVREEATLGARTTLDVLNAEQELLDARANLIAAQVDETIASYTVLSAMGVLTARDLNLNVQLYDPAAYYNLVRDAPTVTSEQGRALDRVLESIGE
jgi:outer membrane protein